MKPLAARATEVLPSDIASFNKLYERKEWGQAIAAAEKALDRYPGDPLLLYNLACYESLDGRRESALGHLGQALAADPGMQEMARSDSDFAGLADDPEFRTLVAP